MLSRANLLAVPPLLLLALGTPSAGAQEAEPPPAAADPSPAATQPSEAAAEILATDPLAPDAGSEIAPPVIAPPLDDRMVEVSLGSWAVKTAVADALGVGVAAVPLTIAVEADLAAEVCAVARESLTEQSVVAATRTCAARTYDPTLADLARDQMPATER